MKSSLENVLELMKAIETHKADETIRIEKARIDLLNDHKKTSLELLNTNRECITWIEEMRSDLRKEIVNFQKKYLPEIHTSLGDGNVPPDLINKWLDEINQLYMSDVSLSSSMLSVDINDVKHEIFQTIVDMSREKFDDITEQLSEKCKSLIIDVSTLKRPDECE